MPGQKLTDLLDKNRPWLPSDIKHYQQRALKALDKGEADSGQQRVALKYFVNELANAYEERVPHYFADSTTDTAFALGRKWVGDQIRRWLTLPMVPDNNEEPYDDR